VDRDGLDSYKLVGPYLVVYLSFWKFWRPKEEAYAGTPELYRKVIGQVNFEKLVEASAAAALLAGMADGHGKTACPMRDETGKVHGNLPKYVPQDWTQDQMDDAADELQESIIRRKQEQQQLGEDGPHRRRIAEEEDLLRQLVRKLEDLR
jgi:hypothetical protein